MLKCLFLVCFHNVLSIIVLLYAAVIVSLILFLCILCLKVTKPVPTNQANIAALQVDMLTYAICIVNVRFNGLSNVVLSSVIL